MGGKIKMGSTRVKARPKKNQEFTFLVAKDRMFFIVRDCAMLTNE